jgi:hypothetical protein
MKASAIRRNSARKTYAASVAVCLILVSILALSLPPLTAPAASSESAVDYFNLSYDPATFSKTNILRNEAFSVTIHGNATCTDDLPPIRSGRIIGRVVASNVSTGHRIVINSQYTVNIDPFPNDPGEYTEMTVTVPLQFPASDIPGDYSIIGETITAEVYLLGDWEDVTDSVPASHVLGSVHYATSGTASTPTPTPTHTSIPSVTSTPSATATPTATATSNATTSPTVTATPGASVMPAVSPSATATTTAAATPVPTGTTTENASSLTPDGATTPAHYGAPIWAAIGLIVVLILAIIILAIVRLQTRLKHAVQSDESLPEDVKNKQV